MNMETGEMNEIQTELRLALINVAVMAYQRGLTVGFRDEAAILDGALSRFLAEVDNLGELDN
jgi:hypothetical protein